MKFLKTFKVYEINTVGTYLSKDMYQSTHDQSDIPLAKKLYGKIFAEAPTTTDKDWGIQFKLEKKLDKRSYFLIEFTDTFFKNFIRKNDGTDSWWKGFLSIFGIGGISFRPLERIRIFCEYENYNRIHFPKGIPKEFRGIKLGYVIYEAFIKHLGYASSNRAASTEARQVWSDIAEDPDFYCVLTSSDILAIHKDCKEDLTETIYWWMKSRDSSSIKEEFFEIDEKLFQKYKNLKQKYEQILQSQEARKKMTFSQQMHYRMFR